MPRTESGLHGDIFFLVMLFLLLPPSFSEPVDHLGLSEEPIIYVYQMTQIRVSYTNQALSKLKSPAPSHTSSSSPNHLGQESHTPLFLLSLGGSQPPYFPSLTHQAKGSQSRLGEAGGEREGLFSCRGLRECLAAHEQNPFCFQECRVSAAVSLVSQETRVRNCPFLVNFNEVPFPQRGGKPSFKRQRQLLLGKIA